MQTYKHTKQKESLLRLISLKNKPHCYQVELALPMQSRFIGQIDMGGDGGTFFTVRKAEHIFRKTNSIGINTALLNNPAIKFKWIDIKFGNRKLVTTREFIKAFGQQYQFSNKDFELQTFLPLDKFGVNRARLFEKVRGTQTDMFSERLAV